MRFAFAPALLAVFAVLSGCKASVEGDVKTGKSGDEIADFDKPMDPNAAAATRAADPGGQADSLLGARQDLSYKGPATPRCKCLAVATGQPTDAAFQWAGARPGIDLDTQLIIAISSAGVTCDAGGATGASYWGYEVVGQDVVVVVEAAKPGVPTASGAIIPRPSGNGQVYVRPVDKSVPYGLPASGPGQRCQVATLKPLAAAPAPSTPVFGTRIRTDEADPTSTRTEIPQ